jgi:TorA maturation chaperone TorD
VTVLPPGAFEVLQTARAQLYGALSGLFARELTLDGWVGLCEEASRKALAQAASHCSTEPGARPLLEWLLEHSQDDSGAVVEALAVEYARLFIGPGPGLAPPYESFYAGSARRFYGEAVSEVAAVLRNEGVEVDTDFGAPADHVAIELSLMRYLASAGARDASSGPPERSSRVRTQCDFLDRHLLRWVPDWAADVAREDKTGFYRAAVELLDGFLRGDRAWLETQEGADR